LKAKKRAKITCCEHLNPQNSLRIFIHKIEINSIAKKIYKLLVNKRVILGKENLGTIATNLGSSSKRNQQQNHYRLKT
jgi:hypothetical protein